MAPKEGKSQILSGIKRGWKIRAERPGGREFMLFWSIGALAALLLISAAALKQLSGGQNKELETSRETMVLPDLTWEDRLKLAMEAARDPERYRAERGGRFWLSPRSWSSASGFG